MGLLLEIVSLCFIAKTLHFVAADGPVENLEVKVLDNGGFQLYLSGKLWFNSADAWIHNNGKWYSTQDQSLVLTNTSKFSGRLDWGPMEVTNFQWKDNDGHHYTSYTVVFQEVPVVIFGQQWDDGGMNVSVGQDDTTLSMWPTLRIEDQPGIELGYTTWAGGQIGSQHTGKLDSSIKEIYNNVDGGFPLAIFDSKMENTLVISPQNTFMSGHQTTWKPEGYDVPVWGSGFLGKVESIPAGYSMETVMVAGQNVSDTMNKWGMLLRERYGKTDDYRRNDFSINYLGYYTDNGGCYHYNTGPFDNYEQVVLAVKKHTAESGIPYQYLQLDSWWYYKGVGGGVKNWTAQTDVFPRGIDYVSEKTEWPIVAHNRWFSIDTDYAKQNGGDFNFIIDKGNLALPDDPSFWQYLLKSARDDWNLRVYEQDWLLTEFGRLKELEIDLGLGKTWLDEMGEAAKELGITIQYCMAWTRHALQSVMIPAVTQMRVSRDYHPGNTNWMIGDSIMLAHALGIAAFKDTFRTITSESNCQSNDPEPYPVLETYIATLSGGPVGPGDNATTFNKTLIMTTCMTDGLLLKPTRPAMSIDGTFLQRAFGSGGPNGEVYSSYSVVRCEFNFCIYINTSLVGGSLLYLIEIYEYQLLCALAEAFMKNKY